MDGYIIIYVVCPFSGVLFLLFEHVRLYILMNLFNLVLQLNVINIYKLISMKGEIAVNLAII